MATGNALVDPALVMDSWLPKIQKTVKFSTLKGPLCGGCLITRETARRLTQQDSGEAIADVVNMIKTNQVQIYSFLRALKQCYEDSYDQLADALEKNLLRRSSLKPEEELMLQDYSSQPPEAFTQENYDSIEIPFDKSLEYAERIANAADALLNCILELQKIIYHHSKGKPTPAIKQLQDKISVIVPRLQRACRDKHTIDHRQYESLKTHIKSICRELETLKNRKNYITLVPLLEDSILALDLLQDNDLRGAITMIQGLKRRAENWVKGLKTKRNVAISIGIVCGLLGVALIIALACVPVIPVVPVIVGIGVVAGVGIAAGVGTAAGVAVCGCVGSACAGAHYHSKYKENVKDMTSKETEKKKLLDD